MAKNPCGPHTELASNEAVRVTRCGCGTVHVTLLGSGVTIRMNAEQVRGTTNGLRAAVDRLDDAGHLGTSCIN